MRILFGTLLNLIMSFYKANKFKIAYNIWFDVTCLFDKNFKLNFLSSSEQFLTLLSAFLFKGS
jgi:hypothetical protein